MNIKQLKTLGSEEMLLQSLIGKVAERLPLPKGDKPFYRKKDKLIQAGNIVLDFIDSGAVTLRKDVVENNGEFKSFNMVKIVGGKSNQKDPLKGFESTPGKVLQSKVRNYRLRGDDKDVLRILSSIPIFRSEFVDDNYLQNIHDLIPVDKKSREQPFKRIIRYEGYKHKALALDQFYLTYKYDGRGRMYPEGMSLEGFRPHGKAYETFAFELKPKPLNEEGRDVLKTLHPYEGIVKQLRGPQITKALNTGITGMTVECDISNSGLLVAGLLFRSKTMLSINNGYGFKDKTDSHSVVAKTYNISRDEAKQVNMLLLHGGSFKSLARLLLELTGKEYSIEEVEADAEKAYGNAVHNINTIAEYGVHIMSNFRSSCSWLMPDGFRATHRAYTEHVPLELQLEGKKVKLLSSMPLLLDGNGRPVYDSNTPGALESTSTKMMGLYANIVHSVDAYVMREVIRSGIELLPKHDAFLIHPNDVPRLRETLQEIYSKVFEQSLVESILHQIEEYTGIKAPKLHFGDAENKMMESNHFLSVE